MNKKNINADVLWEHWYSLRGSHENVSEARSLELKEMGFFANSDLLYDLNRHSLADYVSDRKMCDIHPINGWLSKLIDDKRFIPILFRNKPHLIPELNIGIEDGEAKYIMEDGEFIAPSRSLSQVFADYTSKYGNLFVKPAGLSGGRGAFIMRPGEESSSMGLIDPKHAYLANNLLKNESYANRINPNGINTIRPYFFRGKNGVKIFRMIQRFGTSRSGFVDNVCSGGVACSIDYATGRFVSANIPLNINVKVDRHPESGVVLKDFVIPEWEEKRNQLEEIVENLSFLDFAACDVAVTDSGMRLLEVNSLPNRQLMQLDEPALLDPEFCEFLISKGYKK